MKNSRFENFAIKKHYTHIPLFCLILVIENILTFEVILTGYMMNFASIPGIYSSHRHGIILHDLQTWNNFDMQYFCMTHRKIFLDNTTSQKFLADGFWEKDSRL